LLLQLAAGQDVEELVRSPELHVRLDRDRVIGLQQGIQQVLDRDRRLALLALAEFFARQDLLRGESRRELDDVAQAELPVPLVLQNDSRVLTWHDEVELIEVGPRVLHDLVAGLERTAVIEVAGVPDLGRPVAHDEHDLVPPLRELTKLS
jgi:hypothetical protein